MSGSFRPQAVARLFAALGSLVVVATSAVGADVGSGASLGFLVPFVLWALLPYGVLLVLGGRLVPNPWVIVGAGSAALAVEIGIRLAVFVFPRGSTAALALLFSPAFILVACLPIGAAGGWVLGRAMASSRLWWRTLTSVSGLAGLCLTTVGLARPDLFPTTMLARQRALERIGPLGVRTGGDAFAKTLVSEASAWRLTGAFDADPGDEIAIVEGGAVALLDPQTLTVRERLPLSGESARWNWFSALTRSRGRLIRVDGGGGFQDTRVWALDGTQLWNYHPDPQLPPSSLRDGDVDGDGETEFYATTERQLVRLDPDGREVWRQPFTLGTVFSTHPPDALGPGWVVTTGHDGTIDIWSADGQKLRTAQAGDPGGYRPLLGVVDWFDTRLLALGGQALALRRLDGTTRFEWRVDDMSVLSAHVVRFAPGGPPRLVVLAGADRDTHRYRVQIVTPDRAVLYDEVTDALPRLLTARAGDGSTTLLLGGSQLHALRPLVTAVR